MSSLLTDNLRLRLSAGLAAQSLSQVITIGIQLISVPILISAWGIETYGIWLLISAIPTYLALADLGFSQVGASDMTMRVARGDRAGARETFQTIFVTNCAFGLMGLVAMIAVAYSPIGSTLIGEEYLTASIRLALLTLSVHALFSLAHSVLAAGMRSEGAFPFMSLTYAIARLADAVAVILCALAGGDLLTAAFAMLGSRAFTMLILIAFTRNRWPSLTLGFREARLENARQMLSPSLHYTGYALGNLVSLHGMTIVVGAIVGPTAAAVTSTTRTLARLGTTASTMLNSALLPEYSARLGQGQWRSVNRLFIYHMVTIIIAACAYLSLLLAFGPAIYQWWTGSSVTSPPLLLKLLILSAAVEMIWTGVQAPAVAANRMRFTGVCFPLVSTAGLAALAVFGDDFGVISFGWVSLGVALVMVAVALLERTQTRRKAD